MTSSTPQRPTTHQTLVLPVTVVVADDNHHFRTGMVRALGNREDFSVLGHAADGASALDEIRRLRPQVALVDARMPVLDGFALTRVIQSDPACVGVTVILLSARADDEIAEAARAAGARAFVDKTQPRRRIGDLILAALEETGAP
jgi:two-component system nitrate/nitrite response regulator NarL